MTNLNDGTNEGFRHRTLPDRGGAVPPRSVARTVRRAPPLRTMVRVRVRCRSHDRVAAAARSRRRPHSGARMRQPLQRLTVHVSSRSRPTPRNPQHERSVSLSSSRCTCARRVPQIDNIDLPISVDARTARRRAQTQAGPGGTPYRETITVVAHHAGKIAHRAGDAASAIDARDGKAKQYSTNALTLHVTGAATRRRRPQPVATALQDFDGAVAVSRFGARHRRADGHRRSCSSSGCVTPAARDRTAAARRRRRRARARSAFRATAAATRDRFARRTASRATAARVRVRRSRACVGRRRRRDAGRRRCGAPRPRDRACATSCGALERAAFTYDADLAAAHRRRVRTHWSDTLA